MSLDIATVVSLQKPRVIVGVMVLTELTPQRSFVGANLIILGAQHRLKIVLIVTHGKVTSPKFYGIGQRPPDRAVLLNMKIRRVVNFQKFPLKVVPQIYAAPKPQRDQSI